MYEIKYRKAEEMKDSGVEWLGEIPKEWSTNRLKYLISDTVDNRGKTPPIEEEGIPLLEIDSLDEKYRHPNIDNVNKFISLKTYNEFLRKYLSAGDILFATVGSIGKVAIVPNKFNYCIAQNIVGFKFKEKLCCNKYWYYTFKSIYFKFTMLQYNKGNIQDSIKISNLIQCKLINPSVSEQQKIANFLDIKTAQFDSIISKKEKLIEKLEEAKKSLISEVITGKVKIVDGQLVKRMPEEMKDSGVEWLGMISKEWEIGKLNFLARRITDGAHISPEVENGVYPFVSVRDLKNDSIDFQNCLLTSSRNYEYLFRNACNPKSQDVLISKDGTIGKTVVIDYNKEFVVASSLVIISPFNSIDTYYLNYALNSNFFQKQIMMYAKGAALPRISITHLKNCKIVFTRNYDEQQQIVMYLNEKVSKLINIGSKIGTQIQKLKQAKQSLISEAVTGKIDLRDWEIIEEGE